MKILVTRNDLKTLEDLLSFPDAILVETQQKRNGNTILNLAKLRREVKAFGLKKGNK